MFAAVRAARPRGRGTQSYGERGLTEPGRKGPSSPMAYGTLKPMARAHRPLANRVSQAEERLSHLLTQGGDERITLDRETGLNRYFSAPYPRDILAYSSSTISDISPQAFAYLLAKLPEIEARAYSDTLEALRARICSAVDLPHTAASIAFAASGTDLEYVALACALGRAPGGVHTVLLGADETGSGCIHSAQGRAFASRSPLGRPCRPGEAIEGCGSISLVDVPVRCEQGVARLSAAISADFAAEIERAMAEAKQALVHLVHGSKTGLVVPSLADLDALQARYGEAVTFVIDACQARITTPALHAYLERGCVVMMTGSKFIGAPPFSGWALIPKSLADTANALPSGFGRVFRRVEWPQDWPGAQRLEEGANLSLALRLNAALFEWECFQALPLPKVSCLIALFERAGETQLVAPLGLRRVCPHVQNPDSFAGPIEMRTLITLDVTQLPGVASFEDAQALHRKMALDGVRLGQPVKCVRAPDGQGWGATLRVGLSMPQMVQWAALDEKDAASIINEDMQRIANAIRRHVSA